MQERKIWKKSDVAESATLLSIVADRVDTNDDSWRYAVIWIGDGEISSPVTGEALRVLTLKVGTRIQKTHWKIEI